MEIPKQYTDLVGTKQKFSGYLFSKNDDLDEQDFDVKAIRWGTASVVNVNEIFEKGESSYEHPTFELLLKNDSIKRAK